MGMSVLWSADGGGRVTRPQRDRVGLGGREVARRIAPGLGRDHGPHSRIAGETCDGEASRPQGLRSPRRRSSPCQPAPGAVRRSTRKSKRALDSCAVGPPQEIVPSRTLAMRRVAISSPATDGTCPAPTRAASRQGVMGTSDPRYAAAKLGVDRHEARAADLRTIPPWRGARNVELGVSAIPGSCGARRNCSRGASHDSEVTNWL